MPIYVPTVWNPGLAPGISAANLNNLETQNDLSIREEGSHLVEQSHNNLASTAMSTVGALTIAVDEWILIVCQYRKTAGHASVARIGLELNATEITVPQVATGAVNGAGAGALYALIGPREANYLASNGLMWFASFSAAAGGATFWNASNLTAASPAAVITDITIRGLVDNALNTVATKNLYVYTFGG